MQKLLELKGVSRRVSDRFSLRDVTLAVEPGQIVGFVGANGAGKTTTIRAALGLIKPDAGEVHLLGQRCDANAPDETQRHLRSRIGLVLDTCPFPSTLKVGQVEKLVGPAYPTWSCETFAGFIDRFGLDPKTKVKDLSRGMGMKLTLAFALSHNPELLVLDEATAMLDPVGRRETVETIRTLNEQYGITVLLITHHMDEAAQAQRLIVMAGGHIIDDGPPAQVFQHVDTLRSAGLAVPETVALLYALKQEGFDVPLDAISDEACAQVLADLLKKPPHLGGE